MEDKNKGAVEVMNVQEAAAYLGLGVRTVYNLAKNGKIPAVKLAGAWRFPKVAIDTWMVEGALKNLKGLKGGESSKDPKN